MGEENKYSNNELGIMLKNLSDRFDEHIKYNQNKFEEMISHQKTTNGNVKANTEHRIATQANLRLIKWLITIFGGLTVINVILTIMLKADKLVLS